MSTFRDQFRRVNFFGSKFNAPPEYASGVQSMKATTAANNGIGSSVAQIGLDAVAPGLGSVVVPALNGITSGLQDENGLYKNKTAGYLNDHLNPVQVVSNGVQAISDVFTGDWRDGSPQDRLRNKIEEEKKQRRVAENQSFYGAPDPSSLTATPYANGTSAVTNTATKDVVIEGREPVFSAPGADGKRELLHWYPQGPSHAEGGIPVNVPDGAAIITKKSDKGQDAIDAYIQAELTGNNAKLERIIKQMPADHAPAQAVPEMAAGTSAVAATGGYPPSARPATAIAHRFSKMQIPFSALGSADPTLTLPGVNAPSTTTAATPAPAAVTAPTFTPGEMALPDDLASLSAKKKTSPWASDADLSTTIDTIFPKGRPSEIKDTTRSLGEVFTDGFDKLKNNGTFDKLGTAAGAAAEMAPAIYNLSQGLFGSVKHVERRHVTAQTMVAPDLMASERAMNRSGLDAGIAMGEELSGGNAANARAHQGQAWNEYLGRDAQMEDQQANFRFQAYGQNVASKTAADQTNTQLDNQYDQQDTAAQAAKSSMLRQGLTDLSNVTAANHKNAQDKAQQDKAIEAYSAATPNFEYVKGADGQYSLQPKNMRPAIISGSPSTAVVDQLLGKVAPATGSPAAAVAGSVAVNAAAPTVAPPAVTKAAPKTAAGAHRSAAAVAKKSIVGVPRRTLGSVAGRR